MRTIIAFFISCFLFIISSAQSGWQAVASFGTNPGALNMYSYAPATLPTNAPLVVVLHGCTENATSAASETGWNTMANRHNFYTVYPEQIAANNSSTCFNWFLPGDQSKNQGEALSIKQMVDYMVTHYSIDTNRIFVTGLSAGACMTSVMMACYPETFNKGAIVAGAPYKAANNSSTASSAMGGFVSQTPIQWGDLVRNENPTYSGPMPRAAVFHGTSDPVVNINNATELVKQWTNVNGADQTADAILNNFNGNSFVTKSVYNDPQNKTAVETYIVNSFGHAVGLDTGSCYQQCGTPGTYAYDINFSYTFWAAYFFDILTPPAGIVVSGADTMCASSGGYSYSVPSVAGSSYNWSISSGATIATGQNTNSIIVNFGTNSVDVSITETTAAGCKNGPVDYPVTIQACVGITSITNENEIHAFYNSSLKNIEVRCGENSIISDVKIVALNGTELKTEAAYSKNTASIATGTFTKGLYIVTFTAGNKQYRKKILLDD